LERRREGCITAVETSLLPESSGVTKRERGCNNGGGGGLRRRLLSFDIAEEKKGGGGVVAKPFACF